MVVEAPEPEAEPLDVLDDQVHALGGSVGELGAVRGQDRGPPGGRLRDDISPDRASRAGTGPQGRHLCARNLCPRTTTLFREGRLPAQMPANTAVATDLAKVRVAGSSSRRPLKGPAQRAFLGRHRPSRASPWKGEGRNAPKTFGAGQVPTALGPCLRRLTRMARPCLSVSAVQWTAWHSLTEGPATWGDHVTDDRLPEVLLVGQVPTGEARRLDRRR
jgi:hypothetical protein